MTFEVVYLTGPPASGKTTLCKRLEAEVPRLAVFHYSSLLVAHIRSSRPELSELTEDELRERSASIIQASDVETVDRQLIKTVRRIRKASHVIIDSHAVTKEPFGYRVTPFSGTQLRALQPTMIAMIYAEAGEIAQRISRASGGRPSVTVFQADFHTFLQAQIALAYGLQLGLPVYVFDATKSVEPAIEKLASKLAGAERPNI
jgi:adenylate kinase